MEVQNPPTYRNDTVLPLPPEVTANAWAVDAACSGNEDSLGGGGAGVDDKDTPGAGLALLAHGYSPSASA